MITNLYFIIDCSMNITENEKFKIQKSLIGYQKALKALPFNTKAHYIGFPMLARSGINACKETSLINFILY